MDNPGTYMNPTLNTTEHSAPQAVAAAVLAHLAAETELIRESIHVLTDMRQALSRNESDQLVAALEQQRIITDKTRGLLKQRQTIKQHIARVLNISLDAANISRLAQKLEPETRDRVLRSRRDLLSLHREADAINRGIAALASQSLAMMQYCVGGQPQSPGCVRYSATGSLEPRQATSTMEARV